MAPILTKLTQFESGTIQLQHIKISALYHSGFDFYERERERTRNFNCVFFEIGQLHKSEGDVFHFGRRKQSQSRQHNLNFFQGS